MTNHSTSDKAKHHKYVSLNPDDAIVDPLDAMLKKAEEPDDLKNEDQNNPHKYAVQTPGVVVEGLYTAIHEKAEQFECHKGEVQRRATKLGYQVLQELPDWDGLENLYFDQLYRARVLRSRYAINESETLVNFRFAHAIDRSLRVSLYHWVAVKVEEVARVAGWSQSQVVVILLILAFSAQSEWEGHFDEDIGRVKRHLKRRRSQLSGIV